MPEAVKRPYDSSRRRAQARATRAAVVDAAQQLFVEGGYATTTIEEIGDAAGVPLATLYRLFGSKLGILKAVLEVSFVGDDEPAALHDRPLAKTALSQADPHHLIAGYARVCRDVLDRAGEIQHVLRHAAAVDPAAAELLAAISAQRLQGQSRIARALAQRKALAPGITERQAADIIYTLMAPEVHRLLTVDRRWSGDRYERWLAGTLAAVLLAEPNDRPSP